MEDEPRYYTRHVDANSAGLVRDLWGYVAHSFIRDRWYGCRDVVRFERRDSRKGDRRNESVEQMRAMVDSVCAVWNAEHEDNVRDDALQARVKV